MVCGGFDLSFAVVVVTSWTVSEVQIISCRY
jgi:hypothetical protein